MSTTNMFLNFGGKWDSPPFIRMNLLIPNMPLGLFGDQPLTTDAWTDIFALYIYMSSILSIYIYIYIYK